VALTLHNTIYALKAVYEVWNRVLKRIFGCKRGIIGCGENSTIERENVEWTHLAQNRNR
jgi:hypothetical protein